MAEVAAPGSGKILQVEARLTPNGHQLLVEDLEIFSKIPGEIGRKNMGATSLRTALRPLVENAKNSGFKEVKVLAERYGGSIDGHAVEVVVSTGLK